MHVTILELKVPSGEKVTLGDLGMAEVRSKTYEGNYSKKWLITYLMKLQKNENSRKANLLHITDTSRLENNNSTG